MWSVCRAVVVAGIACVLFSVAGLAVSAQAPPPDAPSNAHVLGGVLSWEDNSSDETGFRVVARLSGSAAGTPDAERSYDVPPNSTSFVLPADAQPDCDRSYVTWLVFAANGSTLSAPALAGLVIDCAIPVAPSAQPPAPSSLPPTGASTVRRSSHVFLDVALLAGIIGGLVAALGRYKVARRV